MSMISAAGRVQEIQSTLTMLAVAPARPASAALGGSTSAAGASSSSASTSSSTKAPAAPATPAAGGTSAPQTSTQTQSSAELFAGALAEAGVDIAPVAEVAPAPAAAPGVPGASGEIARLVEAARQYEGIPYVWGGTDPAVGLDCSGFVQRAYADIGIQIPRVTWDQMNAGTHVGSLAEAQPGDLLFSHDGGHVSMYLGGGKAIDAPQPGQTVAVRDMWENDGNITTIRRFLPTEAVGSAAVDPASVAAPTVDPDAAFAAQSAFLAGMAR